MEISNYFLEDVLFQYQKMKKLAGDAIIQINDQEFFAFPNSGSNSIAIIVKHISGNMISRWTDFMTSDGEKHDRNRPQEFDQEEQHKRDWYLSRWEKAWQTLFDTIQSIEPEDILSTVTIRQEPHTVMEALHRQLTHYAAHIGQITFLAKYWKGDDWSTLSIPKDSTQRTGGSYKS